MAKKRDQKDESLFRAVEVAIHNAQLAGEINTLLGGLGIDAAYLQRGQALLDAAMESNMAQGAARGKWLQATADFGEMQRAVHRVYMRSLKVARVVFAKEEAAWAGLRLGGARAQGFARWYEQVSTFYHNLLGHEDWLARMGQFGFDREQLAAEQAQVTAVASAHHAKEEQRGASREATQAHRAAVKALRAWMSEFRTIAKIALDNDSALLTGLGM